MTIKEQIDRKLKCGEEDRQELKKELRYNKSENLANYFFLARASEEKLQQRADKVETTDKERERHIRKDIEAMKKRYETLNDKLWDIETRMNTMRRYQAESLCAMQFKVDALLRNCIAQEKTVADRTEKQPGTRVEFVEPQRKKQESTQITPDRQQHRVRDDQTCYERGSLELDRGYQGIQVHTRV